MSVGALVGAIITVFGAIAASALFAAHFVPGLAASVVGLWIVFICGFSIGLTSVFMFGETAQAGSIMYASGVFCTVLGLLAGGVALAALLGMLIVPSSLHLWLLMIVVLPLGVLLVISGNAARKTG